MTVWHDPDPDRALLARVTLACLRRAIVEQLPTLPPAILDLVVADAAAAVLPYMIGVVEIDGELWPLQRGTPPPEPELVG